MPKGLHLYQAIKKEESNIQSKNKCYTADINWLKKFCGVRSFSEKHNK